MKYSYNLDVIDRIPGRLLRQGCLFITKPIVHVPPRSPSRHLDLRVRRRGKFTCHTMRQLHARVLCVTRLPTIVAVEIVYAPSATLASNENASMHRIVAIYHSLKAPYAPDNLTPLNVLRMQFCSTFATRKLAISFDKCPGKKLLLNAN